MTLMEVLRRLVHVAVIQVTGETHTRQLLPARSVAAQVKLRASFSATTMLLREVLRRPVYVAAIQVTGESHTKQLLSAH